MKLPERILFVGAHCDDIELIAGGLLARAASEGAHIGVLVFSDHRGVVDELTAARARREFEENLNWLRTEMRATLEDHSGTMLTACRGEFQAQRGTLYAAMESVRDQYDLVVTHSATDTNQDHQQVSAEAMRVFKGHATLLGGEFPNNDIGSFTPQTYFTLAPEHLEAKVKMVGHYRSQDFGGRPYLDAEVVRALARLRGSQIRERAAEAFTVLGRMIARL